MLVFLYDKMLHPEERAKLKLPLRFLGFAYIDSALYMMKSKTPHISRWTTYYGASKSIRRLTNTKVFGAVFLLEHDFINLAYLDAFYGCSKASLGKNNINDLYHREKTNAAMIGDVTIANIKEERYKVLNDVSVDAYYANEIHPKFANRIYNVRHRVSERMNSEAYEAQYEAIHEETGEDTIN